MSISTTSGRWRRASSTASAPSLASATTRRSAAPLSIILSPNRTTGSSSATSTSMVGLSSSVTSLAGTGGVTTARVGAAAPASRPSPSGRSRAARPRAGRAPPARAALPRNRRDCGSERAGSTAPVRRPVDHLGGHVLPGPARRSARRPARPERACARWSALPARGGRACGPGSPGGVRSPVVTPASSRSSTGVPAWRGLVDQLQDVRDGRQRQLPHRAPGAPRSPRGGPAGRGARSRGPPRPPAPRPRRVRRGSRRARPRGR